MQKLVIQLIDALRDSDPYIETIYTKGGCYQFHLLLKKIWPNALPVTNGNFDHVASLIYGKAYDIRGEVDWAWRAIDEDEIKIASGWSFSKNQLLQLGECPICEEPLVV